MPEKMKKKKQIKSDDDHHVGQPRTYIHGCVYAAHTALSLSLFGHAVCLVFAKYRKSVFQLVSVAMDTHTPHWSEEVDLLFFFEKRHID